jgi:hypothetical protein
MYYDQGAARLPIAATNIFRRHVPSPLHSAVDPAINAAGDGDGVWPESAGRASWRVLRRLLQRTVGGLDAAPPTKLAAVTQNEIPNGTRSRHGRQSHADANVHAVPKYPARAVWRFAGGFVRQFADA